MTEDQLTAVFAALSDPTRRTILIRLAEQEATVGELAAPLDLSLPSVSKHVKVLQQAGLVMQRRDAQRRICRLEPEPLHDIALWAERFRRNWENAYQRLDGFLDQITAKEQENGNRQDDTSGT